MNAWFWLGLTLVLGCEGPWRTLDEAALGCAARCEACQHPPQKDPEETHGEVSLPPPKAANQSAPPEERSVPKEEGAPQRALEPPCMDLNQASREEILSLPGVGPSRVERILAGRPIKNHKDLLKIKGIGRATLKKITPLLCPVEAKGDAPK